MEVVTSAEACSQEALEVVTQEAKVVKVLRVAWEALDKEVQWVATIKTEE